MTYKEKKRVLNYWNSSSSFQRLFLAELLKDCLFDQISSICLGVLAASKSSKKDQELVFWIQENIIGPAVFDQVELCAYEELWDQARTITESQKKPLAKYVHYLLLLAETPTHIPRKYEELPKDEAFIHFLQDHHRKPPTLDEGKSIYSHRQVCPQLQSIPRYKIE